MSIIKLFIIAKISYKFINHKIVGLEIDTIEIKDNNNKDECNFDKINKIIQLLYICSCEGLFLDKSL